MLTASRARITFKEAIKLLLFARKPSIHSKATLQAETSLLQRTLVLNCTRFSSMADSGEQNTPVEAGGAGGAGGEGEPVVKSAKQLKKDAKKKEKLEKFQQKQAKMAAGQQKQNNSGSEARLENDSLRCVFMPPLIYYKMKPASISGRTLFICWDLWCGVIPFTIPTRHRYTCVRVQHPLLPLSLYNFYFSVPQNNNSSGKKKKGGGKQVFTYDIPTPPGEKKGTCMYIKTGVWQH